MFDKAKKQDERNAKFEVSQIEDSNVFVEKNSQSNMIGESLDVAPFHKLRNSKSISSNTIIKNYCRSNIKKIKYVMLQKGTLAGNPKLIDNLGFSYTRSSKNLNSRIIKWQCINRANCPSSVIEIKRIYKRINDHCHEANPDSYAAAIKLKREECSLAKNPELPKVTRPNFRKGRITKSKQPILIIKGKNDKKESMLIDKLTGYCYILKKSNQFRPNIFKCLQNSSEINCRAYIKKVGKSYVLSCFKHHHLSNPDDLKLLNKKPISKLGNTAMELNLNSKKSKIMRENSLMVHLKNGKFHQIANLNNSSKSGISHVKENKTIDRLDVNMFDNIVLPKELEIELCLIFKTINNIGLSHDSNMFLYLEAAKLFLDKMSLNYFPPNNLPSKEWIGKFIRRHPVLSSLMLERLKIYKDVDNFQDYQLLFRNFQKAFKDSFTLDAVEYLSGQYSDRIFCLDVIELIINIAKLVVTLEMKNLKTLEDGQRIMTVLCCINSLGNSIKPLIINKGELPVDYESNAEVDDKYSRANSFSGFLTKEVFHDWLILFDKEVEAMSILKPVVLFLNGNFPFISYASVVFARSRNIFIFYLPSHLASIIHPFRRSIFKELKTNYLKRFENALDQNSTELSREQFPSIFMKAYKDTDLPKLAKDAFFECGLCPYNLEVSRNLTQESKLNESSELTRKDDEFLGGEIVPSQFLKRQKIEHKACLSNFKDKIILKNLEVSSGKVPSKMRRRRKLCVNITQQLYKHENPVKNLTKSKLKRKYKVFIDGDSSNQEVFKTNDILCNRTENYGIINDKDDVTVDKIRKTINCELSDKNCGELVSKKCSVSLRSNNNSFTESSCGKSLTGHSVTKVLNEVNNKGNSEAASLNSDVPVLNSCQRKSFRKTVKENSFKCSLPILPKLRPLSNNYDNSKHVQNSSKSFCHVNSKSTEITPGPFCISKLKDLENSNSTLSDMSLENLTITENSVITKHPLFINYFNEEIKGLTFNGSSAHESGITTTEEIVEHFENDDGHMTDLSMKSSIIAVDVGSQDVIQQGNSTLSNMNTTPIASASLRNSGKESLSLSQMDATSFVTESFRLREGYNLALHNMEEVFKKIIDPFVLGIYQKKFKANIIYRDTTFLLWRSLQMLKSSPLDLMKD